MGMRPSGPKEVLSRCIEQAEGATFWMCVMTELSNRGLEDLLLGVVDGLKGCLEAITNVLPPRTDPYMDRSLVAVLDIVRLVKGVQNASEGPPTDLDTTNTIESPHSQVRKVESVRGYFPSDEAAPKLIWLVPQKVEKNRVKAPPRWHAAKCQFAIMFGDWFVLRSE
jgi:putative transposase